MSLPLWGGSPATRAWMSSDARWDVTLRLLIESMDHRMTSLFRLPAKTLASLLALMTPTMALAQAQPSPDGNPLVDALNWMMNILLGPVATALAVMAVAGVGFMMLTGRMNWRYGGTVIIGVFIIFGAPRLVQSISGF
jgi:type IV secretory pathway VirB2 component (pilin)